MITKSFLLFIIFPVAILCSGMSCAPHRSVSIEMQRSALQSVVEKALGDLEFAYESKNLEDFMKLLDKGFEGKTRFQSVLSSYFFFFNNPQLHFVIDMVISDKNGVVVRLHWFRRGVTSSLVTIKLDGSAQFLFKKYPDGLRLRRIDRDNPFF